MSEYLCPSCLHELQENVQICPHCGNLRDELQTPLFSEPECCLPLGTMLHNGRYLVGLKKGSGACSFVYAGLDVKLKKRVAIKELFPFRGGPYDHRTSDLITVLWTDEEKKMYIDRFRNEARLMVKADELAGFSHLYDMFYENNTAYLIENYIEGQTVAELELGSDWQDLELERTNKLVQLLLPTMKAINQLHICGVIHCDINPTNILFDRMGQSWIVDFGKAVQMGVEDDPFQAETCCLYTAPPELVTRNAKIGPWTDVYSICALICRKLTLRDRDDGPVSLGDIPEVYHDVFLRGLAENPQERIQNMTELMEAFQHALLSAGQAEKKAASPCIERTDNALSNSPKALRRIELQYGQIFNSESCGGLMIECGHMIGKIYNFHFGFEFYGIVQIESGGFRLNSKFADEDAGNAFNDQQAILHRDYIIESGRYDQNLHVTVAKLFHQERGFQICFDDQIISAVHGETEWSFLSDNRMIACLIRTKNNIQLLVYEPLPELKVVILSFISWFGV